MNKTKRNGLQVLLTVLMLSALCLTGIAAADVATANETTIINTTPAGTLPTSYDLRDYGLVTPVRDQTPFGTCWAHGVIGAIESNVLKKGLVPLEDADKLDLSEAQMIYFMGNRDGVTNGTALPGYEDTLDSYPVIPNTTYYYLWGYLEKAAIYHLAAGFGVTTEDNDDLKYANLVNLVNNQTLSPELAVSENAYYPKSMIAVDIANRDTVKEHLMKYGAATIGYYSPEMRSSYSGYIDENGKKVLIHNCVLYNVYQNTNIMGNHVVTLVGWNDTYSKENFPKFKKLANGTLIEIPIPEHDGAWIIKNSWGNTVEYWEPDGTVKIWDGYVWISYDDTAVGNLMETPYYSSKTGNRRVLFYDMVPSKEFYDNIYQYDAGLFSDFMFLDKDDGYLTNVVGDTPGDKQTIATKNVYTAKGPEFITAVGINTMNDNVDYQIQVIVNNVTMSTVSDTATQEGYYVIDLPEPVFIRTGDIIEIPIEFSRIKTGAEDLGAVVDIATNASFAGITGGFVTPTGIHGRSYVKYQYETRNFTDTNASELLQILDIDIKELIKLAINESVLATLSPEQLDLVNESIKQVILTQIETQNALQKLADEDGWIDLADIPSFITKKGEFTYGSARIKMFTVDTEEETVTGNGVRLSNTDMVKAIAFTKVAPDSTVYYAENLPNQILPEGDLEVLGGFQIIADGAKKYGTKTALVFRVNATNPEQVTLMYQNRFGTWMHVPTIHLSDNRYLAVTPSLAPLTVVECRQTEDFNPKFRFGSDRFPRLFPTVNTTILTR